MPDNIDEPKLPFQPADISVQEFLQLWRNIHNHLQARVAEAKKRSDDDPCDAAALELYILSLKEFYSYLRLVAVAGTLGQEVNELRHMISLIEAEKMSTMFVPAGPEKKNKPN